MDIGRGIAKQKGGLMRVGERGGEVEWCKKGSINVGRLCTVEGREGRA
jgi:hypothetical protein